MNRQIVYVGAIPQDTDILLTNKNAMIGSGWIAQSVMGTGTLFYGLACTPTGPATLTANVAPGCVFSQQNIDNSAYGSLTSDTSHQIVKVGINQGTLNFACPAPVTSGQSVVYLIQAAFVESDTGAAVLPYYNAANPATPWAGPNNTGVSQNTIRQDICSITLKTGVAATTGTQVTPAPDVGFTGLWAITVANGQSTVTSGNIAMVSGAPLITESLTQKISQTTADARYAQIAQVQTDALDFALDTGTTNALVAALSPVISTLTQGMSIVLTVANSNNGPSTLNLNGLGNKNITYQGNALQGGELVAGQNIALSYNGATWNLMSVSANQSHVYTGGTSTGSANAQVVASVTPSGFSLIFGNIVTFTAGFTNTGATTANISSTGVITIKKKSSGGGLVDLAASDLTSGQVYQIIYDGVFWELYSLSFPPSSTFFQVANNLSEGVPATMRSNLGLGSAALLASTAVLQKANNLSDLANISTAQTNLGVRNVLTGNTTYHVSTTGNDSTGTGSSGAPWLTIQHAVNFIYQTIDSAGFAITISAGNGTFTGGVIVSQPVPGGGTLQIVGNTGTPSSCIISTTGADCFLVQGGASLSVGGFKLLTTTSGNCLNAGGGTINITGAMEFGACAGLHMFAHGSGSNILNSGSNYTISGNALWHVSSSIGSVIYLNGSYTVTLTGTPAFSNAFAEVDTLGAMAIQGLTFSGIATGVRYTAGGNGVINTNGAASTYLPGNINGTTSTGGQYL